MKGFKFPKLDPRPSLRRVDSLRHKISSEIERAVQPVKRAARWIARKSRKKSVLIPLSMIFLFAAYVILFQLYSSVSPVRHRPIKEKSSGKILIVATDEGKDEILLPPEARGEVRIAIILDDAGGDQINYAEIFSIRIPITISVLPNLPHSSRVVAEAKKAGMQAILHLPMEPENGAYVRNDGGMVLESMNDDEIKTVVLRDLSTVPGVIGVNNHMGSRSTQDPRVMFDVLAPIKEKGLFFVDSRTAKGSLAYSMARSYGIRSARNSIFLDVLVSEEAVEERLKELVGLAKRDGYAIGIGHATRPATILAIKRLAPVYGGSGVRFVFASSLVK